MAGAVLYTLKGGLCVYFTRVSIILSFLLSQRMLNKIESCWSAAVRTCRRQEMEKERILSLFCSAGGRLWLMHVFKILTPT
jgi:hypothetical protein